MLGGSFATITNDSIKIVSTGYSFLSDESKEIVTEFKMAMTVDEKINLAKTLKKINLKRLKRNYVGKRISYHNFEFDFIFTVDGQTKETKIYEYKHRQILNLVRLLNKYLNGKREIMYNDWYIRTFK